MKTAILLLATASGLFAATPVLVRVTPQMVAKQQQISKVRQESETVITQAKVARPAEQSIIKDSCILHDGTYWTLVPKGAVIFLPEAMKKRVDTKPVGTLLNWMDFLTRNRSWITTTDVSFEQAAGADSLPAERVTFWTKQDKVVVATHQSGPISVRIAPKDLTLTQR